jgi:hypothetical protein
MLNSIDMILSPSQFETLRDGNCMMHAILDQLLYQDDLRKFAKDHKELRAKIISMLDFFVNYAPNRMEWPFACMSTEDWATKMFQDTEWGDDVYLSLASHVLNRRIIILSLDRPTSTDLRRIVIGPDTARDLPTLYLLYFTETAVYSPHYQSIRVVAITTSSTTDSVAAATSNVTTSSTTTNVTTSSTKYVSSDFLQYVTFYSM